MLLVLIAGVTLVLTGRYPRDVFRPVVGITVGLPRDRVRGTAAR
jgi:hypothetical protein